MSISLKKDVIINVILGGVIGLLMPVLISKLMFPSRDLSYYRDDFSLLMLKLCFISGLITGLLKARTGSLISVMLSGYVIEATVWALGTFIDSVLVDSLQVGLAIGSSIQLFILGGLLGGITGFTLFIVSKMASLLRKNK